MDTTCAYIIGEADENRVLEGINAAPQYGKKVAGAIKRTIAVIHGLDTLFNRLELRDLEVYLGRSSDDPAQVLGRWEQARKKHRHKYAAMLFTCEANRAAKLEGLANKVLKKLKAYDALCVGNANTAGDGRGRKPGRLLAVIYMTWGENAEKNGFGKADINIIRHVAEETYHEAGGFVTKKQLEGGLRTIKRKTYRARLHWNHA
jgi:hypothetical protein